MKRALCGLVICLLLAGAAWFFLPKPPLLDGVDFSRQVRDRNGALLRTTLTTDQKFRVRTSLAEISPALIAATLQFEDKHFARHPGVNPVALLRAAFGFMRRDRTTPGASTITMQLARLRFHLRTRTLRGKAEQIFRALEIERHYSKTEILEAYLNLAPYGRNIEGIGAATEIYFGKTAARLSEAEAEALSVIPQSPTRRALMVRKQNEAQVAAQLFHYRTEFRAEAQPHANMWAPHFVRRVLAQNPRARDAQTTLDLARQNILERRLTSYLAENKRRGIENGAALLLDFRSMEVLAQIGSADFANAKIDGQVDGTQRARSPGSTLKPLLYALALDQGLIHPLTMLKDAPRTFGEYNRENYDREFLGPIRACDALARSRNLPAVALAAELRHPTLYEFLRGAGVSLPQAERFYGLSLPLGGAEVTMESLVRLYAMLANGGVMQPIRRTLDEPRVPGRRLVSPEAAFLTLEMLGQLPRPGMSEAERTPVFWKTGTSHGFRDAWSIAVFDRYVLAVWIGNFSGHRNPAFIGRSAAAPLLFQMIDALRSYQSLRSGPHLPPPNANLKRVEFCAVSGDLPSALCPHRTQGWFIPGISPIKTCEVHREVVVDAANGLRLPRDDGTRAVRREVYEFWPSDLLALFEQAGIPRRIPPPFALDVESEVLAREGRKPRITLPASSLAAATSLTSVPLRAETETGVRRIYWFADKSFLGACAAREVFTWQAAAGTYELTALDDHGRSSSREIVLH